MPQCPHSSMSSNNGNDATPHEASNEHRNLSAERGLMIGNRLLRPGEALQGDANQGKKRQGYESRVVNDNRDASTGDGPMGIRPKGNGTGTSDKGKVGEATPYAMIRTGKSATPKAAAYEQGSRNDATPRGATNQQSSMLIGRTYEQQEQRRDQRLRQTTMHTTTDDDKWNLQWGDTPLNETYRSRAKSCRTMWY